MATSSCRRQAEGFSDVRGADRPDQLGDRVGHRQPGHVGGDALNRRSRDLGRSGDAGDQRKQSGPTSRRALIASSNHSANK